MAPNQEERRPKRIAIRRLFVLGLAALVCVIVVVGGLIYYDTWRRNQPGYLGRDVEWRMLARDSDPGLDLGIIAAAIETGEDPVGFAWFKVNIWGEPANEVVERFTGQFADHPAIVRSSDSGVFMLMADEYPRALTHEATLGPWGLKSVNPVEEVDERFPEYTVYGVDLWFDKHGTELVREFSEASTGRDVGLIVGSEIVDLFSVQSRFGSSVRLERRRENESPSANFDSLPPPDEYRRWVTRLVERLSSSPED